MPKSYLHRDMSQLLAQGKVYEPSTLNFLRRRLTGGGDIVTGGAFIADFLPALHGAMAPTAQIHTFEPNQTSFAAAELTIRLNGLKRVRLHPVAVGEKQNQMMLKVARRTGDMIAAGERIEVDMAEDDPRGIPVAVVMIDDLVPKIRKVSILHLDVEGFEVPALAGSARILKKDKPMIMVEAGGAWKIRKYLELLTTIAPAAGYAHCGTIDKNAILLPLADQ